MTSEEAAEVFIDGVVKHEIEVVFVRKGRVKFNYARMVQTLEHLRFIPELCECFGFSLMGVRLSVSTYVSVAENLDCIDSKLFAGV